MIDKKFCVFILTHGRPNNVKTLKSLKDGNYTGDYFLICDNEDKTINQYYENFGKDKVIVFDKLEMSKKFDTFDNFSDRRTIVYARNYCFEIAEKLGYKYFLELDDDYTSFEYRRPINGTLAHIKCKQLDKLFDLMIDFLEQTKAITVCLSQGGDFLGGESSKVYIERLSRKAMNTFFCTTQRPFKFIGRINEDVNTYTYLQSKGDLMFTIADADIQQLQTQKNKGGMTDVYLDKGTYLKSFYTIMCMPSAVKISTMGERNKRIHHRILWNYAVPKIINQKWKKV